MTQVNSIQLQLYGKANCCAHKRLCSSPTFQGVAKFFEMTNFDSVLFFETKFETDFVSVQNFENVSKFSEIFDIDACIKLIIEQSTFSKKLPATKTQNPWVS